VHKSQQPIVKDVVLVGAGHAHVQVLKRFGMKPVPGVRLTLITREVHTPYSGMLPGLIAGRYGFDDAHIDTGPLCRFAGARLYHSVAEGIDRAAGTVLCDNRPPVPYDILSIDIGATPNTTGVPGADEYAVAVKPIDSFLRRFEDLRRRVLAAKGKRRILMVGGGASSVELLLSLDTRLRKELRDAGHDPAPLAIGLITAADRVLPDLPQAFSSRFALILRRRGIKVMTGARVSGVGRGAVRIEGRGGLAADEILWATESQAPGWLKETGLALDDRGFLAVDAQLRVRGEQNIFAAGDVIGFTPRPLAKSGVYAVRAGPVLAENIRSAVTGGKLKSYRPQRDAMYLVSTGEPYAVGTRNGLVFGGEWVWRWKDRIDRRFMGHFNRLPEMAVEPKPGAKTGQDAPAAALRCGGCGAKIGADILSRALSGIQPVPRQELVAGLGAPEDAAIIDTSWDTYSLQSVDYFRAMIDDPYLFGRIAANHALNDIFAMGGTPETALAIATLPYGIEAKQEADLTAMMTGANEVLREADCTLTGGHTSEGAELALGFAVTGLVWKDATLRKSGAQPGDQLVLTKPLGTGMLLAADMRGKAKARWSMGAIRHMLQSNRTAVRILIDHGVRSATDITGFGLVGHLAEMLEASQANARLDLDGLPHLDGVREVLEMRIVSSMQPDNLRLRRAIAALNGEASHPLFPLLFDPQTAGGLLGALPPENAEACLIELRKNGYRAAAIVGEVTATGNRAEPIVLSTTR
jgi:selenide,water dikinase